MPQMKCYVLHGERDLRLESKTVPDVLPGTVLIRISRVGICGSDIHYYVHGRAGSFIPREPFILGHEFSGTVVQAGDGVADFREGDRVTVEPAIPCGNCRACRSGRYNICSNMKVLGSASSYPHVNGAFAEYVVVPERACHRLPDELNNALGALVEPISVAVHAVVRAGDVIGKSVLVTGGGTIGQAVLSAVRAFGAGMTVVTDVDEFCRTFSAEHGADHVLDPGDPDFVGKGLRIAPPGFDVVFEASGAPSAFGQAMRLSATGGTLVQIGTQPESASIPINLTMSKELQIVGSFRYANVFDRVIQLLSRGAILAEHLVTHVFPFDDMNAAMDTAVSGNGAMKVHVELR